MTGRQFARVLRGLPPEELDAEVAELVDRYDKSTCRDCGRHHPTVWAALACDGLVSARRRRESARMARRIRQLSLTEAPSYEDVETGAYL